MTTKGNAALSNGRKPSRDVFGTATAESTAAHAGIGTPEVGAMPAAPHGEGAQVQTPEAEHDVEGGTDVEGGDDVEGGTAENVATQKPERRRLRWVTRGAAALAIAAALAGVGYGGWLMYQQHQDGVAARDAQHSAEKYAAVLTSIDTNAIDQNFADVLDGSTGEFKDMYSKSSTQLRQLLLDNKAAAHGTVLESAVQSVTPDRVVVLLFVDQSITNAQVPDPRVDRSRIKMTMDKVDGRWLASKVELP